MASSTRDGDNHDGERGRAPTDEELRAAGIDPADNVTGDQEPPDVLD